MDTSMEREINEFVNDFNRIRTENNLRPVLVRRGHKYTRLIDVYEYHENETTVAFIGNEDGNIYKPASNRIRANGVRGNITNIDQRFNAFTPGCASVIHFKRGRPPKQQAPLAVNEEPTTVPETVGV